ncbi:MAG: hypothetical protein R6U00_10310, partial [Prochlorococcaceae cyanobacterium]
MNPARPHAMPTKPATTWYDNHQRRPNSPFFRRIDRSFKFRVLIAAACSFALLSAVNRFEHCHTSRLEPDCLTSDSSAKEQAAAISIRNLKERSSRRKKGELRRRCWLSYQVVA